MDQKPTKAELEKQLKDIVAAIKGAKTAVVTAHVNPDGDTLGSMLALADVLEQAGLERVDRVMHDEVPDVYKFFPGQEKVLCSQKEEDLAKTLDTYDISFSCDCGSITRLGSAGKVWQRAKLTGNVDHHLSNPLFADVNFVDPDATSTGQVVNFIVEELGANVHKDLASLMYITLLTDTGGFKHTNTNANAMSWGAGLIEKGANPNELYHKLFDCMPFRAIKIIGDAMNKVEINKLSRNANQDGFEVAYTYTSRADMSALDAKDEDTDEIVDNIMRIKDLDMCIYLREGKQEGTIKGSLRSACDIDCSEIAGELNGGGHARAAGFNLDGSIDEIKTKTLELIKSKL